MDGRRAQRRRRLHCRERQQLKEMVRHHVAQGASAIVIAATLLDTERLGYRNLHVVDVAAIPDGFEDAVAETKDQDVLDRFFPEVMIDAVDLLLPHERRQGEVQRLRARQIAPERLFDNDATPSRILFEQARRAKPLSDLQELVGRSREIEQAIARLDFRAGVRHGLGNRLPSRGIIKRPEHVPVATQ
jgi:hypothetical protein